MRKLSILILTLLLATSCVGYKPIHQAIEQQPETPFFSGNNVLDSPIYVIPDSLTYFLIK